MYDDKEKNSLFISDINANDRALNYKIFHYFYFQLKENKRFKTWLLSILIILESLQFISYAFSPNHYESWKIDISKIKIISNIISCTRLSPFLKILNYQIYSSILYILIILIFVIFLIITIQILFSDESSKFYKYSSSVIWLSIDILIIFLYIPFIEIILIPFNCENGKVLGKFNTCWKGIHYLQLTLGILCSILLFIISIFMINFSFFPFQKNMSTIRINSDNDIIITIMKLFAIFQNIFLTNEYLSLTILLLISFIMLYRCLNEPTYNNDFLEIIITIKNIIILWTYFILFLSKLFKNFFINGLIYLLVIGYPVIIYLSILIYKEKTIYFTYLCRIPQNLKDIIKRAKLNIKLINSFIEKNKNNRNENEGQRNTVLLKGNIKVHNITCINKDCPLRKFLNNEGNFNLQRQCLLNYMNVYFKRGLKKYPKNTTLLILFIYFNYSKKFNLNSVKTNLFQLKKLKCTLKESFIIYCMEQNIKNMKSDNDIEINTESDNNISQVEIIIEQKYQNLKYLIENSIRLFGEFWGLFSTNVTNNLNTKKLYYLGEKLNKHLNEINNIWENELKNKKIDIEYQNVIQLYSKFLLEILWNKKKSLEVNQKLNEENMNYQENYNKKKEDKNNGIARIEELIDNQDYILFADSDENGNCKIVQISASLSHFLGYQKYDIIGKNMDIIIPNILIEEHCKYLEECIKILHNEQNSQKDLSYRGNDSNENTKLFISKNRMGYVFPLFMSFKIMVNNDYSDSFLVKFRMENKESKSEYGFYILTKSDFSIENISSSAINLGLSLDLLKKYVVKIDILIRNINNNILNIYENYSEYEDEPKPVLWVYPDIIYPKDNSLQNKNEDIEELIKISRVKKYNMQIKAIKFNPYEISGFFFKFIEISFKRKKIINNDSFIPKLDKNLIMYDLTRLKFFRSIVVNKKSGLRNLRNNEFARDAVRRNSQIRPDERIIKRQKREKTSAIEEESSSPEEFEKEKEKDKNKNILTNERIMELQVHHYIEIKNFIFSLPTYGSDVSLERFTPNGDKYSAIKISDSLIKIQISNFCKRVNELFNVDQNQKIKNNINLINSQIFAGSSKSTNLKELLTQPNSSSHSIPVPPPPINQGEEINKGIISDSSSTLINLFKAESIKYIKILVGLTFICIIIFLIIEFLIVYKYINKIKVRINFIKNGYAILNDLLYTKFFVTEELLGWNISDYLPFNNDHYIMKNITEELLFYKNDIAEKFDSFTTNDLCQEYKDFMANTNITIYTLTMETKDNITLLFKTVMDRIPATINDLAKENVLITMSNREIYALMYNLINEYYINWEKVTIILFNDCLKTTELKAPLEFIILGFLLISVIILVIFLKLLSIFSLDREKPINLFLTIKKRVFENLKNSADSFSNKLLNKFFGNEDNEEESQREYQPNVQQNDINIVKFKSSNGYHALMRKENSFIEIFAGMLVFLLLCFIYFISKYVDFRNRMGKMYQFITFFDKANKAHSDILLSFNIMKSYLYDKNIPILNQNNTQEVFINTFLNISEKLDDSILYLSIQKSFLNQEILGEFETYLYYNYKDILNNESLYYLGIYLPQKMKKGLKPGLIRFFEILRLLAIKYFASSEINNPSIPSFLMKEDNPQLSEINKLIRYLIRPWYNNVLEIMANSFNDYESESLLYYTIFFISLIILTILAYFIVWKIYEEKLKLLLKGSVDLINLIPQEIKSIIAEKLNE